MSIDYDAKFGIGYQVMETDELLEDEDLDDGLNEYLECEKGEGFDCFQTGNYFTGDLDGPYLVIENPFKDGLDLTTAKQTLDAELKRLKLEQVGEFGVVGGGTVW